MSADRRTAPEFVRAAGLLAHTVMARRLWLDRMTAITPPASYTGPPFPDGTDLERVAADWQAVYAAWDAFLADLTDDGLTRAFEYSGLFGGRFRSRVGDVLPHLFTHSAYHRGQIALLVKQAGGTPALTDYSYRNRETLSPA